MTTDLNELYQQVILDHSKNPRNYRKLEQANHVAEGHNPLCGDRVTIFLKVDNDRIQEISFQGSGCAISKAAASMMTANLKGKTVAEVRQLFDDYRAMVTTGNLDPKAVGKLAAFAGVHKFPARVKCAILPWHAVVAALDHQTAPVTSE